VTGRGNGICVVTMLSDYTTNKQNNKLTIKLCWEAVHRVQWLFSRRASPLLPGKLAT